MCVQLSHTDHLNPFSLNLGQREHAHRSALTASNGLETRAKEPVQIDPFIRRSRLLKAHLPTLTLVL